VSIQFQHRRDANSVIETVTPAAGELGFDTTKKEALIGDAATLGGVRLAKKNSREIVAPPQITANQNDYDPVVSTVHIVKHARQLNLTTDASRNLTGIVPLGVVDTLDGRELTLYNNGSFNLVVQHQHASSAAANRFDLGGADMTLQPTQSLSLVYDLTATRWKALANTVGTTPADASIIARKLAGSAFAAGVGMVNGTLVESHAGNAVTFALKTLAGTDPSATDPVLFCFRDATAANGGYFFRTVTSALSFTFSSGSSAGMVNATAGRIWIGALDNAGTVELFAVNCRSGANIYPLGQFPLVTTTAEGGAGAATSAQVPYSTTARTAKAYVVVGYASYETGLATAGTWNASPTRLQLFGPGVPLPGQAVQSASTQFTAQASGTTVLPADDTIPQSTEGDQYMTQAITPTSSANVLEVEALANMVANSSTLVAIALFQDAAAGAVSVGWILAPTSAFQLLLSHKLLAGTTASTTLKARIGPGAANTLYFNGSASGRFFGGVMGSRLGVKEVMA
jgi:hypothetical protein